MPEDGTISRNVQGYGAALKERNGPVDGAPTILDVARVADVSKSAVSRHITGKGYVSREAAEKIDRVIRELGYKPNTVARALKAKSTKSIGLIVPSIENPVFPPLVKVIEETAKGLGYTTILCISDGAVDQEAVNLELLIEKKVDGILFNAMGRYDPGFEIVKTTNTPLVVLGRKIEGFDTTSVTAGNFKGSFMAVEYLIGKGLKRVAFLAGMLESSTAISDRFNGYRAALGLYGLEYDERLVVRQTRTFNGGIDAADELIAREVRFDSIFASNDIMAIGCMERLAEKGYLIPGDLSVIGYDDIPSSQMVKPKLSTVSNPAGKLGAGAVAELNNIIKSRHDELRQIEFEPELVIRQTTR